MTTNGMAYGGTIEQVAVAHAIVSSAVEDLLEAKEQLAKRGGLIYSGCKDGGLLSGRLRYNFNERGENIPPTPSVGKY